MLKGIESKNLYLIPGFVIGAAVVGSLGFFMHACELLWIAKIAAQKPPSLVETADGSSLNVIPIGSNERSGQAIKEYVRSELGGLFNWTGTVFTSNPGEPPQKDPGVKISSTSNKIASITWSKLGLGSLNPFAALHLKKLPGLLPSLFLKKLVEPKLE